MEFSPIIYNNLSNNIFEKIGIEAYPSSPTPGDGSCFYHACADLLVQKLGITYNYIDLRLDVVQFIKNNPNMPFIQLYQSIC